MTLVTTARDNYKMPSFLLLHSIAVGLPCILQHCVYTCRIAGRCVHRKGMPITQAAYLKQYISVVGPMSC